MPKHKIINALSCKGLRGIEMGEIAVPNRTWISDGRMSSRLSGSLFPHLLWIR
jgi:hypothetical protein